jgi:hypothetical protein
VTSDTRLRLSILPESWRFQIQRGWRAVEVSGSIASTAIMKEKLNFMIVALNGLYCEKVCVRRLSVRYLMATMMYWRAVRLYGRDKKGLKSGRND